MTNYSAHGTFMLRNAEVFATAAHAAVGQVRKYTGEPYINHPRMVAAIVQTVPTHVWQQVAAAWLHDTVEDTKVPIELIGEMFGRDVMAMVRDLTNVPQSFGNRKTRYRMNLEKLSMASPLTKTIKLADLIHNTKSIVQHDPKFAPVYLEEKMGTLEVLREGDKVLWSMAHEQLVKGQEALLHAALAQ